VNTPEIALEAPSFSERDNPRCLLKKENFKNERRPLRGSLQI